MKRTSTTFTVTGGKGGIGKSIVAVNLAETLAAQGHRVALLDASLHLGACALLLNETPDATVTDLAQHRVVPRDVNHLADSGVTLVQTASTEAEDLPPHKIYAALDRQLADLRQTMDYIVIDTPSGIDGPVRWALDRCDLGLLVLVGEPTAISDAYRLARMVWQADPDFPLGSVVNVEETEAEAQSVAQRFAAITNQFVHREPMYLGWVPFSHAIRNSVRVQEPAVRTEGPVRKAFADLTRLLVHGQTLQPVPAGLQ